MGQAAARKTDMIKQDAPHCHAPIHPAAPVPTPAAHPALPLAITMGAATVKINNLAAARVTDTSAQCSLPSCVPGGPGMIAKGSATVKIENMPAGRANDMTAHSSCVAPIPAPVGKVMPPCSPTVKIGG